MVVRIDPIIRAIALSIPLDSLAPTVDRWLIGGRAPVRLCARARAPCCARGMVPVRWTGAPVAMVPVRPVARGHGARALDGCALLRRAAPGRPSYPRWTVRIVSVIGRSKGRLYR